ncbi:MAG: hypothetical protein KGL39_12475 [Patescibacteria group bacterium]|nr:hypothetical protein [Patescibacteria group bacterium]
MPRASPDKEFAKFLEKAVRDGLADEKATVSEKSKLIEQGIDLLQVQIELRGEPRGKKGMFEHGD